ncbi:hypothetical protein ABK040_000282 [Willaertia magna]
MSQQSMMLLNRMKKELDLLMNQPPHGIAAYPKSEDRIDQLEAKIQGTPNTPYEQGEFLLEINIPDKYPIQPPNIRFKTKIYHPNIDNGGRICLDLLNMPPKGGWKPSLNISTILTSIKLLMNEPNADDGLMAEITEQYRNNRKLFEKIAREWTIKYATINDNTTFNGNVNEEEKKEEKEMNKKKEENSDDESSSDSSSSSEDEEEEEQKEENQLKKRKY